MSSMVSKRSPLNTDFNFEKVARTQVWEVGRLGKNRIFFLSQNCSIDYVMWTMSCFATTFSLFCEFFRVTITKRLYYSLFIVWLWDSFLNEKKKKLDNGSILSNFFGLGDTSPIHCDDWTLVLVRNTLYGIEMHGPASKILRSTCHLLQTTKLCSIL